MKFRTIILLIALAAMLGVQPVFSAVGDTLIVTGGNGSPGSIGHHLYIILKNTTNVRGILFNLIDTAGALEVTDIATTGSIPSFEGFYPSQGLCISGFLN